jgi:hypothetical protein
MEARVFFTGLYGMQCKLVGLLMERIISVTTKIRCSSLRSAENMFFSQSMLDQLIFLQSEQCIDTTDHLKHSDC